MCIRDRASTTNRSAVKPGRSYAASVSRQTAQSVISDDAQFVRDFLSGYDLKKVASTFRSIRDRLETADPTERFMLLVEACEVIGLL